MIKTSSKIKSKWYWRTQSIVKRMRIGRKYDLLMNRVRIFVTAMPEEILEEDFFDIRRHQQKDFTDVAADGPALVFGPVVNGQIDTPRMIITMHKFIADYGDGDSVSLGTRIKDKNGRLRLPIADFLSEMMTRGL